MNRTLFGLGIAVLLGVSPVALGRHGRTLQLSDNLLQAQCGQCTNILVNNHTFISLGGSSANCDGGDTGGDRTCHNTVKTGICSIIHKWCIAAAKRRLRDLPEIIGTGDPNTILSFVASDPKSLFLNAARGSIQVRNCDGQTIANIALPPTVVVALAASGWEPTRPKSLVVASAGQWED